jgi:hypothetical protein
MTETLAIIRQAFREESMSCTWVFEWKSPNSLRIIKARQVTAKLRPCSLLSLTSKGSAHNKFVLAGKSQFYMLL